MIAVRVRNESAVVLAAVLLLAAGLLAGCAGGGAGAGGAGGEQTIRVALDWTPNTNHTGLYVAQQEGWFRDAGLDVQFLPYNNTSPDTLVSSGAAEFGISFQDTFTFSKAAGADITSVMAVLQHWATEIAVKADRTDITSPKDLDGKTYGGFGGPGEEPKMQAVIRDAGGKGDFTTVVARHLGLRGAVRRPGRLHRAVHGLGRHRGRAPRPAAQDLRLHRLRLPRRLQRAADRQQPLAAGASRPGREVRAGGAARLPARRRRPGQGRPAADGRQPRRVHGAGARP